MNAPGRQSDGSDPAARRRPLPRALRLLGPPLALTYQGLVAARNHCWDRHSPRRLDRPVISIGNLSAGGTGKTPVVAWIAEQLQRAGRRPAIAMRGYKARRGGKSDEQLEHESRLPGVPVIADPDRHAALSQFLPAHPEIDVILLDDGFQHRRLHRDLDIVLIDALRSPFDDALLPHGYLREPVESLRRADVMALTRVDLAAEEDLADLRSSIKRVVGKEPLVEFASRWSRVDSTDAGEPREVQWLRGRSFVAMCGIGHPEAFLAMIGRAGASIVDTIIRPDHARYDTALLADAARRAAGTDGLLTTAKDWVKIEPLMSQVSLNVAVHRPRLDMQPSRGGEALLARVTEALQAGGKDG